MLTLVLSGCAVGPDGTASDPDAAAPATPEPTGGRRDVIVIVLPSADGLADAERVRLRRLVERLVDRTDADATVSVLEPTTAASLADTLDIAVRRVSGEGTVCVLGARGRPALGAVLARYPAVGTCVVPGPAPSGITADRVVEEDVDLVALGRELGLAARAAAGDGAVLLLDGGDGLLDVRLRRGVEEAVLGATGGSGPTLGVVATAVEAVTLLDEQAAMGDDDAVPGESDPVDPEGRGGIPPGDLPPTARSLRPVTVVILDASPESAALVPSLAERGLRVVAPTVLLDADLVAPAQVVLHWSVRWDVPLSAALARSTGAPDAAVTRDPVVLVPGPAATAP